MHNNQLFQNTFITPGQLNYNNRVLNFTHNIGDEFADFFKSYRG